MATLRSDPATKTEEIPANKLFIKGGPKRATMASGTWRSQTRMSPSSMLNKGSK